MHQRLTMADAVGAKWSEATGTARGQGLTLAVDARAKESSFIIAIECSSRKLHARLAIYVAHILTFATGEAVGET